MLKQRLDHVLEAALSSYSSLFLVSHTVSQSNEITVVIDGDDGVSVGDCANISRVIEHGLDREKEDFSLQVMSAGLSSKLIHIRQFKKNIGRKLSVLSDGKLFEGVLTEVTEKKISLQRKEKDKNKNKDTISNHDKSVLDEMSIAYDAINEAKVMITF